MRQGRQEEEGKEGQEARGVGAGGADGPGEAQPRASTRAAADRDIAAQARAAEAKIRQALIQAEPRITASEIAGYYRTHVASFEREERRYFDIVERYRTPQAARRAMRDGELRNLATFAYHESLGRSKLLHNVAPRRAITKAVFAARPGALSDQCSCTVAIRSSGSPV